jgi:stage V sporulation protein G
MDITEVRIALRDDQKLKAFVSITLDDCFVIRGLKIIEGADGMFVAMPSRKRKNGEYQDVAHPINNKTREWMEGIILKAYREEKEKQLKLEKSKPHGSSGYGNLVEETIRSSEADNRL